MYNAFTARADLTPFRHRPARIDIEARNQPGAPDAQRSAELDFSKEDAAPDVEFNEIIWRSVRGANSPMPAPVRSAFVRVIDDDDDDDGDGKNGREREREGKRERRRR